jgi:uncharacterized protein (DUF1697 family)
MGLWIAFFRGINVGGHNILPMKALKTLLEEMGCENVATYIQSGNVVFLHKEQRPDVLESKIGQVVHSKYGFKPQVLLLTFDQLSVASAENPFLTGESEPKTLHLFFLKADADSVDWSAIELLKSDTEQFRLVDRVFYLYAPDSMGRSKLAAKVEKLLGVPATARNWRTVKKVLQIASAAGH